MANTTVDWYAHCLDDPKDAHVEWREYGVAVLPIGEYFEAVRLPETLADAAAASDVTAVVNHALSALLEGPIIHDTRGRNYYALVEPGTREHWRPKHPGVECLGHGTQLGVPDLRQTRPAPGRPIYWAALPEPGHFFCRAASVTLLVRIGSARLAEAGGERPTAQPLTSGCERAPGAAQ